MDILLCYGSTFFFVANWVILWRLRTTVFRHLTLFCPVLGEDVERRSGGVGFHPYRLEALLE